MTTRTPLTVSSTTEASWADSCWMAMTCGWSRPLNRLASTFTNGSEPSASTASTGSMVNRITVTATTVTKLEMVSGIITTKNWICWRSVLARLMRSPVCTWSW